LDQSYQNELIFQGEIGDNEADEYKRYFLKNILAMSG